VRGRAADFEAEQCSQSFLRWVRENAGPALLAARDSRQGWHELHRVAARYDLEIKPRGAGLVIGHRADQRRHIKASDVDRGLAMKAIVDVLGSNEPPGRITPHQPAASYARPARAGSLYEVFKREREAALAARGAALKAVREHHLVYAHRVKAYYRERFRQEPLAGLRGFLKRDALQHIAEQQAKDRVERVRRESEERRQVRSRHSVPAWQGYLESEAAKGNEAALIALRGRMQRRTQMEAQLLQAQGADEARHIVRQHLRPTVRRDDRVIYRTADGGIVSDEARTVRVSETTAGAAFLALSLAADRFGYRPLIVQGTDDFRAQVAKLAAIEGLNVTFADGALEKQRMSARNERRNGVECDRQGAHTIYDRTDTLIHRDHGR
jgi:hypothetical protein